MDDENLAAVIARIERSARLTEGEADDVSGYQVNRSTSWRIRHPFR